METKPVYQNESEEGLYVNGRKCCSAWRSGLPALEDCYEFHPAFDGFLEEWDDVDGDEESMDFFQNGGEDWKGCEKMHRRCSGLWEIHLFGRVYFNIDGLSLYI